MIGSIFRFLLLLNIKFVARAFYHFEVQWPSNKHISYKDQRIFLLLNHTSLFEPIFIGAFPIRLLWQIARRFTYPIAEKTLRRPIAGKAFRILSPTTLPLTRNRDKNWDVFLDTVKNSDCFIGFAPEGRMRRANGLDSDGRPMTMKGGVVDILENIPEGNILFLYSGGLHHVQTPGEGAPRIFKRIHLGIESVPVTEYLDGIRQKNPENFRKAVIADLESRRDNLCPHVIDMRRGFIVRFVQQLIFMWT